MQYSTSMLLFIFFRYAYSELDGAFTYIFATNGESFDFSEIQIQGNAHLAFKAASGDNTDSATIYASYINGDKTGNFTLIEALPFRLTTQRKSKVS